MITQHTKLWTRACCRALARAQAVPAYQSRAQAVQGAEESQAKKTEAAKKTARARQATIVCEQTLRSFRYLWEMSNSRLFLTYFGQSFFEAHYLLKDRVQSLPVDSEIHEKLAQLWQKHWQISQRPPNPQSPQRSQRAQRAQRSQKNKKSKKRPSSAISFWQPILGYVRIMRFAYKMRKSQQVALLGKLVTSSQPSKFKTTTES